MNQVLAWLSGGDLRSDGMANEVAEFVLENPAMFADLYAGLSEVDDLMRGRTADALEKVARKRTDLVRDQVPEMVAIAAGKK